MDKAEILNEAYCRIAFGCRFVPEEQVLLPTKYRMLLADELANDLGIRET